MAVLLDPAQSGAAGGAHPRVCSFRVSLVLTLSLAAHMVICSLHGQNSDCIMWGQSVGPERIGMLQMFFKFAVGY